MVIFVSKFPTGVPSYNVFLLLPKIQIIFNWNSDLIFVGFFFTSWKAYIYLVSCINMVTLLSE